MTLGSRIGITLIGVAVVVLLTGCFGGLPGGQTQSLKSEPAVSPDGSRVLFTATHDGDPEIYVVDVSGSNLQKLTDNDFVDAQPNWFPSGRRIFFVSDRGGSIELYTMDADGSDQEMFATAVEGEAAPQ
jgi:Tol biopolymer transport system component